MNEHQLRRGWVLCAAVVVGAASLAAQQPEQQSRPGGGLAERFKQLDRNGELLLGCVIDRTRFTVFRSDGTRFVRWADLVPPDPEHPYMISPEMFQAGGMTYFAVQMSSHSPGGLGVLPQDVDCAMWILGLGKDAAHRVARRVDDGAVTGAKAYRFEPEVYVGANEVFLFYNIGNTLHRARTGIKVAADSLAATKPAATPPPAATRAPKAVPPTATPVATAGSAKAVASLAKPSLEVCLSASDAEQATKFFAEGIGLAARGEPRGGTGGVAMRMLLFTAGNSTVKVRVYSQPPAKLPADIAARNGLRVLTIPVEKLDDVVARLKRLGFAVTDAKQAGTTRSQREALNWRRRCPVIKASRACSWCVDRAGRCWNSSVRRWQAPVVAGRQAARRRSRFRSR